MREEFTIERQGEIYVLYKGLLDAAHEQGLRSIDTKLIQVPREENGHVAIVKAVVEMEDGKTYSGIGDCSPNEIPANKRERSQSPAVRAPIRLAETRSKSRALRDAVNIHAALLEDESTHEEHWKEAERQAREVQERHLKEVPTGDPTGDAPAGREGQPQVQYKPARKTQIDLLSQLAKDLRGDDGVERLESRIGKPLSELSSHEADEWIDRLTPNEESR